MYYQILWMRYVLMVVSIVSTVYLGVIDSYTKYTFLCLLFLAVDRILLSLKENRWQLPVLFIQFVFMIYLLQTYQGMLYILFYAYLFHYLFQQKNDWHFPAILLQWATMNILLFGYSLQVLVLSNLMYGVILATLFLVQSISKQKEEIQSLYDRLRKKHYELEEAKSTVQEYAQMVEKTALLEERNRISKAIHDDLGHQLIRSKMMMEAAIQVVPQNREKGMELLYQIRDHISSSMEALRVTVRDLQPTELQLRSISLKQWMDCFAQDSGVKVELEVKGDPYTLFPSVEVILFRNVQEAFTNAIRHGEATAILVELEYKTDRVELTVINNGTPPAQVDSGLGLKGMEERVELINGQLQILSLDPFTIQTILPSKRKEEVS